MLDTYQVGDYVRRFGQYFNMLGQPENPDLAICHITDPGGCLHIHTSEGGNVMNYAKGVYYWQHIASRVGDWAVRWLWNSRMLVLPDQTTYFRVEDGVNIAWLTKVAIMPILSDADGLELHPLEPSHLELVRGWRNASRLMFFDQQVITPEQQQHWYTECYGNDPNDLMWVAFWQGRAVGTGALNHIDLTKKEGEWSRLMIGEDHARGKGIAHRIATLVRDYALDELGLERIYGSLWTANQVTMHIDMTAGYIPYKVEGDITHVQLLRKDWR